LTIFIATFTVWGIGLSDVVEASELSYDYIDGGYYSQYYKGTYTDKNFQGVVLKGSKSLNDTIFLTGSYSYIEEEWSDPGEQEQQEETLYTVGLGGHISLNANIDGVLKINYNYWNRDWKRRSPTISNKKYTDDFFTADLGARHLVTPETEVNGGLEFIRGGSLNTESELFYLGIMREVSDVSSVGATYKSFIFPLDDDYWNANLVLRVEY